MAVLDRIKIGPITGASNRSAPGGTGVAKLMAAGALALAVPVALSTAAGLLAPSQSAPRVGTRFIDRGDGLVAYDDEGSGPLVVLVPGMGDVRASYRFLRGALIAAGYRVATLDVRGHGESSTTFSNYSTSAVGSDVVALVKHLEAGPALLVGASLGAGAVAWAAAEAPDLVKALVLVGPFVREGTPLKFGKTATQLMFKALLARPWGPSVWSAYYASSLYPSVKPSDMDTYRASLKANLTEKGRMEAFQKMMSYSKADVDVRLPEVKAPVLVVMGTKDPDFADPVVEAREVAERLNGRVELVEGAGHYPHAEMPERTIPLVLDFLNLHSRPTGAH